MKVYYEDALFYADGRYDHRGHVLDSITHQPLTGPIDDSLDDHLTYESESDVTFSSRQVQR